MSHISTSRILTNVSKQTVVVKVPRQVVSLLLLTVLFGAIFTAFGLRVSRAPVAHTTF